MPPVCCPLPLSPHHRCPTATSWECPITHGPAGDVGAGVSNRNDSDCLVLGKGDFPCPEGEAAAGRTPTPDLSKASIFPGDLEAETGGSQLASRTVSSSSKMPAWSLNNTRHGSVPGHQSNERQSPVYSHAAGLMPHFTAGETEVQWGR